MGSGCDLFPCLENREKNTCQDFCHQEVSALYYRNQHVLTLPTKCLGFVKHTAWQ